MDNTEYSIFLHIIEGIGFTEKGDDITLNATLNGVKFEVEGHNTENLTLFNSNCIWECMFDDLKRMRTDNRPIKIECFHKTVKNSREVKRAIGFILLPIRSLQMVKSLRNLQITLHWHKLCGLGAEWREIKPEVYLSALITTKEIMDSGQLEEMLEPKPVESEESIYIRPSETSLMLKSQNGIYIKLLESECLLQVGNGPDDCDNFVVTLTLKNAKHLSQLITPVENENPVFRFHYDFLGGPSDLILVPNTDGIYNIHEKISVNFKSSLSSLKEYFMRVFYIPVDLYYNESIIGNYKFTCFDLLPPSVSIFENGNSLWEVKDSFQLQTLLDVFETSARPTVEYVFSLSYVPTLSERKEVKPEPIIDKRARGDMGDHDDYFELPETDRVSTDDIEARSATHRIDRSLDKCMKSAKSNPSARYKIAESDMVNPQEQVAYEIISELEDWKSQQIDDFLAELKRKEAYHLNQLSAEWDRQKKDMLQRMQDKLDECSRLTEALETAHGAVRQRSLRQYDIEREFDKTKHELDKHYTVRFMEIEEKARRLKDEMEYELKLQELRFKELQIEKNQQVEENAKLRVRITELEEELENLRKSSLPREQLAGLFEDLREQTERFTEMEKSKRFYKEQWAKLAKELHKMKLHSLKIQEEKLKQSSYLGIDNITELQNFIFEERAAIITDRSELKTVKDALTSESEMSKTSGS